MSPPAPPDKSPQHLHLHHLPQDVIFLIALHIPFQSLLPMRLTCSYLNQVLTEPLLYKLRYDLEFGRYFASEPELKAFDDTKDLSAYVLKYIDTYFEKKAWRFDAESETLFFHLLNDSVLESYAFLWNRNQEQNVLNQTFVSQEFGHDSLLGGYLDSGGDGSTTTTAAYHLTKAPHVISTVTLSSRKGTLSIPPSLTPKRSPTLPPYIPVRCFRFTPASPNYPSILFHHDDVSFLQYNDLRYFTSTQRAWMGLTKDNFLRGSLHGEHIKPTQLTPYTLLEIRILSKRQVLLHTVHNGVQKLLLFQLRQNKLELIRERPVKHTLAPGQQRMTTKRIGDHLYVYLSNPSKCNIQVTDLNLDADKWTTCPLPKKIRKRELTFREIVNLQGTNYIMVVMTEPDQHDQKQNLLLFMDNTGAPMPSTSKMGKSVDEYWVHRNMVCVHLENRKELRVLRFLPDRKTDVFIEDVFQLNYSSRRLLNPRVAFDQAKLVIYSRRELHVYCIKTGKRTRKFDFKELDANEWDQVLTTDVEDVQIDLLSGRWVDLFFRGTYRSLWVRIEHPEI